MCCLLYKINFEDLFLKNKKFVSIYLYLLKQYDSGELVNIKSRNLLENEFMLYCNGSILFFFGKNVKFI